MACSNFWWVIICMLPHSFRALDQVQVIKGKLDPEWSKVLSGLAGDYDESPIEQTTRHGETNKTGWSLSRFGEYDFVAVIHRKTTSSPYVSLDAGNACGGAIVTHERVITMCGCLVSWYNWMRNGAKGQLAPASVKSKYDIIAEQIYVTQTDIGFKPDFKMLLDKNAKNPPAAPCTRNAGGSDVKMIDVLVVKFHPGLGSLVGRQYMPWPPPPLIGDKKKEIVATLVVFGMMARNDKVFYKATGELIPINMSSVQIQVRNTPDKNCAQNSDFLKALPDELSTKVTCFYASPDNFELCSGLVGSPLLSGGAMHGLMLSNITCETNSSELLALSFDSKTRENVERMAGKELKRTYELNADDKKNNHVFYPDFQVVPNVKPGHGTAPVFGVTITVVFPLSSLFALLLVFQ